MHIQQDAMSLNIQGNMTEQYAAWNDKLVRVGQPQHMPGWNIYTVHILEGDPPKEALINFADNWRANFGGRIEFTAITAEGKRIARVVVYHD